jgi:hypothetical protein
VGRPTPEQVASVIADLEACVACVDANDVDPMAWWRVDGFFDGAKPRRKPGLRGTRPGEGPARFAYDVGHRVGEYLRTKGEG